MASDLINHAYVMGLHKIPKGWGSDNSQVGEHMVEVLGEWGPRRDQTLGHP